MHAKAKYASQFRHNQTTEAAAGQIQAPAAASIASTPVRRVGSITGAKFGAWLAGSSSSLPASFAFSYVAGSMPPTTQNTAGTFQAVPNSPKSSLAVAGPTSLTCSAPNRSSNAATTLLVPASSLRVSGKSLRTENSGGFGAPDAAASASRMRLIAASTLLR